jgi:hypothetical protein
MKFLILILAFIFQNYSISQSESAIPFLQIPVSPSFSGMGATGTSLPTDDPYGFLLNPAQLGYTSQINNFSFIFYPSEINWLGGYIPGLALSGIALNVGYNFNKLIDFPLSIGIGFANPEFNYGEYIRTGEGDPIQISTFESKDYYYAFSLGVGIEYYVQLNAGITYKSITSILSGQPVGGGPGSGRAEVSAIDFGFLLNVPVIKLIDEKFTLDLFENIPSKPYLNLSTGLAITNLGDEVYYIDQAQADPLPRSARLGYGISTGIDLKFTDTHLTIFDLAFTVDAWDILIERYDIVRPEYQSGLGDIDFGKHVIEIKGDNKVVSHAGLQISLLETVVIRNGHFNGRGFHDTKTNGVEIRSKGLIKAIYKFSDDPIIKFIADHFDVRYYDTNYFADFFLETKITGIALVISGFEFW